MTVSLLLYGSRARGDHRKKSDVDLLGIKPDGNIRFRPEVENVSVHEYPFSYLEKNAASGDLFLLHIVTEAQPLADDLDLLGKLKGIFRYREDYSHAKEEASAVFWFCNKHSQLSDVNALRKKLSWALRTSIIADAAEKRSPIFSSEALAAYAEMPYLEHLLNNRDNASVDHLIQACNEVIDKYYRHTKPSNESYEFSVKWLYKKGGVASSTPAALRSEPKSSFFEDFYN